MVHELIFHKEAIVDFENAAEWYETQKKDLGIRFLLSLDDVLNKIKSKPLLFATVHKNFRNAVMDVFPFSIYYCLKDDTIVIVGIVHQKRNPAVWKKRKV
jgi:hypothetical protein